jgi:spermidine/putrescine-binding protein
VSVYERRFTRGGLLKAGAAGAAGLYLARPVRAARLENVTLNWLTWSDHYANDQLAAVKKAIAIQGRPTLFSDNADAYLKIKQTGSQFDIV